MSREDQHSQPYADLRPESRLEIEASVEEYERLLTIESTSEEEERQIRRKTKSFRQKLIEHELADARREIDEIRREERFIISANMILSLVVILAFIAAALLVADRIEHLAEGVCDFIANNLNWFYVLLSSGFLIFLVYLSFSRFGHVVLGAPEERPEFSNFSWYSMLFSAGMGVGILFWGSGEPLHHYLHPPVGDPRSVEAARLAMAYSAFHWGLHAWGIYTVCAVGVAYYGFRKRKKYLISSSIMDITHRPMVRRVLKVATDLVATLAVVFGVAASLGLGTLQIASGIKHTYGVAADTSTGNILIMATITLLFLISASTGLKRGIKFLSNLNMLVAVALLLFVFIAGPSLFTLKLFVDSIGQYLYQLPQLAFKVDPFTPPYQEWMKDWTLTYFTWWIAWAPFVGIFIARISRGRTIRELIAGSLLLPAVFCILWFSVFGGAALHIEQQGGNLGVLLERDVAVSLFALLSKYPLHQLTSTVAILLLFTFLITSADSAVFVIGMMTTEGDIDPKLRVKILWGVLLAVLTVILLLGGGLRALQAAALTYAFPFSIVLILITISIMIRLSIQVKKRRI